MERELPRRQPESDVPELETIKSQEDQEVIAGREIPLHEELGFDSIGQMEQARAMQAALLKEKDMAKADKLRAELKAFIDDSDGEPAAAPKSSIEDLLASARAKEAEQMAKLKSGPRESRPVDSPLEQAIAKREFEMAMRGPVAARAAIESEGADEEEIDAANKLMKRMRRTLTTPVEGTDETKIEQQVRKEFEKEQRDYENAPTEAYEADDEDAEQVA